MHAQPSNESIVTLPQAECSLAMPGLQESVPILRSRGPVEKRISSELWQSKLMHKEWEVEMQDAHYLSLVSVVHQMYTTHIENNNLCSCGLLNILLAMSASRSCAQYDRSQIEDHHAS